MNIKKQKADNCNYDGNRVNSGNRENTADDMLHLGSGLYLFVTHDSSISQIWLYRMGLEHAHMLDKILSRKADRSGIQEWLHLKKNQVKILDTAKSYLLYSYEHGKFDDGQFTITFD